MTGATYVTYPGCGRLMLGQRSGGVVYPQPHECSGDVVNLIEPTWPTGVNDA